MSGRKAKQKRKAAKAADVQKLGGLKERFSRIWIVDGSRLDAIAHRLKILWP